MDGSAQAGSEQEEQRLRSEQLRQQPPSSIFSASPASMSHRSSAPSQSSSSHRVSSSSSLLPAPAAADEAACPAASEVVKAEAPKLPRQPAPPPPAPPPPPSPPPVFSPSTPVSPLPLFSLSPVPSPPLVALPSPLPSATPLPHSSQLHFSFLHSSPLRNIEQPGRSFHLDIPLETADFQRELSASGLQYRAQWEVATIDHLLSALSSSVCLHISGHGDPRALVMEDGLGGVVQLQVEVLERVLRMGGVRRLRFVFVSSCYSYRAALAFSVAGVAHVMAVQEGTKVTDSSARVFACAVYAALCRGQTVREAYEAGQRAVASLTVSNPPCCCAHLHVAPSCSLCRVCRTPVCCPLHSLPCHSAFMHQRPASSSSPPAAAAASSAPPSCCQPQLPHDEFLKFLLLPSACSQDEPIFSPAAVPVGPFINRTPPSPPHNLPPPPPHFGGRARDQLALVSLLLPHRVVAVTAVEGMGKSAVAVAAARYLMERRHFSAVWRVDCAGLRDVRHVDRELARVLGVGGGEGQEEQDGQELSREEELRLHERVVGCLRHGRERTTVLLLLDNVDALLSDGKEEENRQRAQDDVKAEPRESVWVEEPQQQPRQQQEEEPLLARQGGEETAEVASVSLLLQQYQRLAQLSPEEVKGSGRGAAGRERSRERLRSAESSSSNRALSSPPTTVPAAAVSSSDNSSDRKLTHARRGEDGRFATVPGKKAARGYHPILPSSSSPPPLVAATPGWEEDWDDWEEIEAVGLPAMPDSGGGSRGRGGRPGQRKGPSLPLSRFTRNNNQQQQQCAGGRPHTNASELSSPEMPSRSSSAAAASSSLQSLLSLSVFSSSGAASSSVSGSGPLSGSLAGLSPLIPIISESSALWRFVRRAIGSSRTRSGSGRRKDSGKEEDDNSTSSATTSRRPLQDAKQTRWAEEDRAEEGKDRGRDGQDERDEKAEQQQSVVERREGEAEGELRWPEVELAALGAGVGVRDAAVTAAAAAPLTEHDEEIALTAVRMGFPRSRCVQAIQTLRAQRLAARKTEQQQQQQQQQQQHDRQPAGHPSASPCCSSPSSASPSSPASLAASVPSASSALVSAGDGGAPDETWEDETDARIEGEQEAALLLSQDEITLSLQSLLTWLLDHEGDGADEPYVSPPHIYLRPLIDDEPPDAALQQQSRASSSAVVVIPPASASESLSSSPSSLRSWLLRHQLEDQLGPLQQHGVTSLSQLLSLDDAQLKAAGITPLGRRKSLLRAMQQELETQQQQQQQQQQHGQLCITVSAAAPLRGKQAVAQYLLSLLEQTSCHFLITSRSPLPRIPSHPSRRYELPPLHPLDTVQLYLRASSPLNPAQLRPFVSSVRHLPDLLAHPLFSCMAGNARATVLCALLGSAVSVYNLWQLLREEEDSRAEAMGQETGLSAEAMQRLADCRRLVREMRRADETQPPSPMPPSSSSFSVSPVASPHEPQPLSPLFACNAFAALAAPPPRPLMSRLASEPLHSHSLLASAAWTPPSSDLPSVQPSSVSSLFNSLRPIAPHSLTTAAAAASASQSLSPPSSSLYPPAAAG